VSNGFLAVFLVAALGGGAGCAAQAAGRPAPQPAPSREQRREEAVIILEREAGYWGVGPVYTLIIYPDGRVAFIGVKNTRVRGLAEGSVSRQALEGLVKEFERINYFSLRDRYDEKEGCPSLLADAGYARTWFRRGERRKSVTHYLGCLENYTRADSVFPPGLYELERLIDQAATSGRWIR
jgi:hypothetical protein